MPPRIDEIPLDASMMTALGWSGVDVVLITGDAFVDHPAFGAAVIARVLLEEGFKVGVIARPDWKNPSALNVFGRPRLFAGITSGNLDSMLARYTAFGKVRNDDPWAPDNQAGGRPERATLVYANLARAAWPGVPLVLGGIEASMRRFPHYDFREAKLRRSIALDARADLLVYGSGEEQTVQAARRISDGQSLAGIPGTVCVTPAVPEGALLLPSSEEVMADKTAFNRMMAMLFRNSGSILAQPAGGRFIVQYPRAEEESYFQKLETLPFTRRPSAVYAGKSIPACAMIENSVIAHRGCVSGCSFCSLALHQGRRIISRSEDSILHEIEIISRRPGFKGHITDIGGPTAHMYGTTCAAGWKCNRESCLYPSRCKNLRPAGARWFALLRKASKIRGVRHLSIGSGIRYDLLMDDVPGLLPELVSSYVGGQLKIAPEHTGAVTLRAMRKTPLHDLEGFVRTFRSLSAKAGGKYYLLPYLMSAHPGTTRSGMEQMLRDVRKMFGFVPKQVQCFIPLPMTLASVIYYTGVDPLSGEEFFVARSSEERRRQHDVFFTSEGGSRPGKK